jgi:hypothetical protein
MAGARWAIALSDENAMSTFVPYECVELPTAVYLAFTGVLNLDGMRLRPDRLFRAVPALHPVGAI